MTLGKLSQIRPGSLADLGIDGDRWHCGEERLKNSVLLLTSSVPKLCNGHGRAEERRRPPAHAVPLRENARVASARDLDQNIRVNQNGFQDAILLSRFPLRSRRM